MESWLEGSANQSRMNAALEILPMIPKFRETIWGSALPFRPRSLASVAHKRIPSTVFNVHRTVSSELDVSVSTQIVVKSIVSPVLWPNILYSELSSSEIPFWTRYVTEIYRITIMKHLAAYLLLGLGGNTSPSASDVKGVLESVGIDADEERLDKLISELKGKDISEV